MVVEKAPEENIKKCEQCLNKAFTTSSHIVPESPGSNVFAKGLL